MTAKKEMSTMNPLDYAIGQMAAQSVRHEFEHGGNANVSFARPVRLGRMARGFKKLARLAARRGPRRAVATPKRS
jgi:hypothetical protein